MKTIANIKVGKADVTQTASAHIPGVREGNALGPRKASQGLHLTNGVLKATARRSTGITPEDSNPIDPNSPVLPPA